MCAHRRDLFVVRMLVTTSCRRVRTRLMLACCKQKLPQSRHYCINYHPLSKLARCEKKVIERICAERMSRRRKSRLVRTRGCAATSPHRSRTQFASQPPALIRHEQVNLSSLLHSFLITGHHRPSPLCHRRERVWRVLPAWL